MPIPKLKSNFSKRKISDIHPQFSHRSIAKPKKLKKKKLVGRFLYHKRKPKIPKIEGSGGWFKGLIKRLWPYALGLVFIGGIFLIGLFAWYSRDLPEPGKIMDRPVALSTKIYDRTGEVLLYEVHGPENRTLVSIEDIPDHVVDATIAIEDKNFYNHQGISVWGILRGQIVPRLQGKRAQGGSTLTQQFVKNAILTNERKLSRKIKEWILSWQIEKKYDKDQILEFYFNEIPYGGSVYGVQAAAQYYFDKTAQELTIAEAAILAALPQAPTLYSPYGNNKDLLIARQQTIINLMVEQEYISIEEAVSAKAQGLVFKKRAEQIKAPHFVMYVRELLEQKYGASIIQQGGWEIKTSLDWDAQQKAQEIIDERAEGNLENYEANNAALVSMDVETGELLAMIGSKDYFNDEIDGQVNVALAERQPGSSMKPLAYLAAFDKGYRPDTIIFDLETNFAAVGDDYKPKNYDLEERGPVSMRKALAGSLNIPAVKTLYLAGVHNTVDLANRFGYSTLTDPDRYGLSLVLGGGEVKLLEHVSAYATFAREGIYKEPTAILEIKDSEGEVIEKNDNNKGRRVLEKESVRILNDVLSDNGARAYVFGEINPLTLPDRPVAAKTGTTNDYRDAWTMGFTPNIATGVWVGNNDNTAMGDGASGSTMAAPIWQAFMKEITKDRSIKEFKKEDIGKCDKPMVCGELSGAEPVKVDTMSGKLATEYTPYTTTKEKKFLEVHTILHYINTNDPLGDPLSDPNKEPQYSLWEGPILAYAEEQGYTAQQPPTEYDDIHVAEDRPSLNWDSPNNKQTITSSRLSMSVDASAPRGMRRVEYFLDDELIGTSYSEPFDFTYQVSPFIVNGRHELKAIAFDDRDNFKAKSINIDIDLDSAARDFNLVWLSPTSGDTLKLLDFPINLELNLDKPSKVKKIDFYYVDLEDRSRWFAYIESPYQNKLFVNWDKDIEAGVYKLYMVVKDQSNNLITTPSIIVNVE
ncbi:MAG: penicillin-binding protein [Candidatus Komeilibacteria bacterium]|jgi:1A family penicillin-binding protein|nr:penicillin-binding protein [Candidatus Komeilibacteria bacterium]MBT4447479.1 penicillin-binding protein [Candidatus Komeilibacteria bacterium]